MRTGQKVERRALLSAWQVYLKPYTLQGGNGSESDGTARMSDPESDMSLPDSFILAMTSVKGTISAGDRDPFDAVLAHRPPSIQGL